MKRPRELNVEEDFSKIRKKEFEVDILLEKDEGFTKSKKFPFPVSMTQKEENKSAILISEDCRFKVSITNNTNRMFYTKVYVDGLEILDINGKSFVNYHFLPKHKTTIIEEHKNKVDNNLHENNENEEGGIEWVSCDLTFSFPRISEDEDDLNETDLIQIGKHGSVLILIFETVEKKKTKKSAYKPELVFTEEDSNGKGLYEPTKITDLISKERGVASVLKKRRKSKLVFTKKRKKETIYTYELKKEVYTKYSFQACNALNLIQFERMYGLVLGDEREEVEKLLDRSSNNHLIKPSTGKQNSGNSSNNPVIVISDDEDDEIIITNEIKPKRKEKKEEIKIKYNYQHWDENEVFDFIEKNINFETANTLRRFGVDGNGLKDLTHEKLQSYGIKSYGIRSRIIKKRKKYEETDRIYK